MMIFRYLFELREKSEFKWKINVKINDIDDVKVRRVVGGSDRSAN